MKQILEKLYRHETFTSDESRKILIDIASGVYNNYQVASFLTTFIMRNITLDELKGFRTALLELAIPINLGEYDPIDLCGTGGDGKNTFNISTLSSFVVAGAGISVAKHGNYGVSSISGSSNVLEALGVQFETTQDGLKRQMDTANISFLHAPLFHPALKHVAQVRKELGVKTFFNMLGPLVNPARPKKQLTGVFNLELARLYQYLLEEEGVQFSIVHALDGYDEISLTGDAKVLTNRQQLVLSPKDFGFAVQSPESIYGGDTIKEAAQLFLNILEGKGTKEQNNVVLANSALAIQIAKPEKDLLTAVEIAKDSLFNQKALDKLNLLKQTK
ncbi:anthranilate phosphoribosyltransferase [Parvicella tangerina]|uniref:Anthranilate phosphoribosyltransferase n=1 Tax=Parvicella tangerina TaxID=2829795 RepID=A0A916NBU8_9FLAO|nr:anthranilate phosphoribosyltransferase [Parvicella tangerina]CAG5083909.1 Anthranilate phosphoribosyltransferase [Parvicella tangerina]